MKKKWLIRAAIILGVCMAALLIAAPAMAMWDWCDVDPVVSIGGHTVSLDVSIQGDPQQINGHIVFTVSVPQDIQIAVISCAPGVQVKIRKCDDSSTGIPVEVSVGIKTKDTLNTQLSVSLDGVQIVQEQGTTDCDLGYNFVIN
jgi:hypothetical protein